VTYSNLQSSIFLRRSNLASRCTYLMYWTLPYDFRVARLSRHWVGFLCPRYAYCESVMSITGKPG